MYTQILLSPREVQKLLGVGNTKFWSLVKDGAFPLRSIGRLRKVHIDDLRTYVDGLKSV